MDRLDRRQVVRAGPSGLALAAASSAFARARTDQLLNVSYDVARELFSQINPEFVTAWKARAVVEALQADVVTLNQDTDINFLQNAGLIPVFLVRAGNPKNIREWGDLARPGVQVLMSNPKTSGNGRYAYPGAYAYALQFSAGDDAKAQGLVARVLGNVLIFDSGGRCADYV